MGSRLFKVEKKPLNSFKWFNGFLLGACPVSTTEQDTRGVGSKQM
ncbi:hypothetical protein [Bacillus pakistanensis]|nr:hypothetical protein [Bacillus pakistanensis]